MTRGPLVLMALSFGLGIVLAQAGGPAYVAWLAAGAAAAAGAILAGKARWQAVFLSVLWVMVGALRLLAWQGHPMHGLVARLPEESSPIQLAGRLSATPVEVPAWPSAQPEDLRTTTLELAFCREAGSWQPCTGRLRAYFTQARLPLKEGDEVLLEGRWQRTAAPGNPGQYNRRAAWARRGIHGVVRVAASDAVVVLQPGRPSWPSRGIEWVRGRWRVLLARAFDEPETGLWRSLLLGERAALDEALERAFVETGTIHLLVVSGFNVGLVALLLEALLRFGGVPFRVRLGVAAAALAAYSAVTGAQPPVVRATVMAWVVLGSLALERELHWPSAWAAAWLGLLLFDPQQLAEPSFQLSFGAVACLIGLSPALVSGGECLLKPLPLPGWLRRYVALNVGATVAVSLGLMPLLAWYFYLITPVALIANLLLVPLFSVLIAAGTGLLILATLWSEALLAARGALSGLLDLTLVLVRWCQSWPGGHWVVGQPSPLWMAGYYGLFALTLAARRWRWPAAPILAAWVTAVAVWAGQGIWDRAFQPPRLQVDVLDVGHGDSLLLRLPEGPAYLIDAGTEEAARTRVLPFLRHAGIRRLDGLILTHPDADHIGGAPAVLEALTVGGVLTNGVEDDTMAARRVRALRDARHIPLRPVHAGLSLDGGPHVRLEVLHPPRGLVPGMPPPGNDNSLVLRVAMGEVSFLLTGDLEEAGLPTLLASSQPLQATVLKVPHHGSRLGAAGEAFFARVRPQWALLSVGRLHRLPAAETLAALARAGAVVYATRDHGALHLETDGHRVALKTFR